MDLTFTPEEEAFRHEVRSFFRENLPDDLREKVRGNRPLAKEDYERWQAILHEKGWLAASWPERYGGPGWTATERHIVAEEMALAYAPRLVAFGLNMLGPVLIKFGSEEQKKTILPRILDGSDWWCQGYSEPGAGSDLANLKTTATRDGDDYIINGQKTWTTLGQHADKIFCLVRTDPEAAKPQEGISFILVDLETPGIEMRPIRTIDGGYEVNEVFFTDVRVPAANLVGEENAGWTIAKYLLTHERTNIAGVGFAARDLSALKELAARSFRNGKPLSEDPLFMAELMRTEIDLEAMRITNLRVLAESESGAAGGPESSMLKIKGTVILQKLNSLTRQALGAAAAPFPADALPPNLLTVAPENASAAATYFNNRKLSIFGGSNEIQRNIIAKDLFGK
ncbi:acyl-CoA dehydrogenase family protein [Paracoccus sediminicola]|uniref:acyl-CoA dehydrogenase family protein n=1 Tax=Paracoccus sediminicola TaxID=3017783 RepID=UPI0022F0845C|nr:acyl-CoA dehydrogenase family protein [Paracoccus sediminicola]WBU56163.1 acyl-CoA dehydrogenase family protein [Paracoccus sediminicola]